MICPIKNLGHLINPDTNRIYSDECNPDCQLWDKDRKDCGLKASKEVKVKGAVNTHAY